MEKYLSVIFPKPILLDKYSKPKEKFYTVEDIKAKRLSKKYGVEYLIKWKGYDRPEDNSWESAEDCKCAKKIMQFEKELRRAQMSRKQRTLLVSRRPTNTEYGIPAVSIKQEYIETDLTEEVAHDVIQKVGDMVMKAAATFSLDIHPDQIPPKVKDARRSIKFLGDESLFPVNAKNAYQVESGKPIRAILHVNKGNTPGSLRAMVKYEDNQFEFVPTSVLCVHAPKVLVQFYEKKYTATWKSV